MQIGIAPSGSMLSVSVETFFDRSAVNRAMDRRTRRVFSRFGGFTRKTARRSIRKRKGISAPGHPPHSHEGFLRRSIVYGYDRVRQSVVIGPLPKRRHSKGSGPVRGAGLLEFGGRAWGTDSRGRRRQMYYRPRPFMHPAFEKTKQRLPQFWRESVG